MPPTMTHLINVSDANGDRFSLTRLLRPPGTRAYLAAIRTHVHPDLAVRLGSNELRGSVFLTPDDLIWIRNAIVAELAGEIQ